MAPGTEGKKDYTENYKRTGLSKELKGVLLRNPSVTATGGKELALHINNHIDHWKVTLNAKATD